MLSLGTTLLCGGDLHLLCGGQGCPLISGRLSVCVWKTKAAQDELEEAGRVGRAHSSKELPTKAVDTHSSLRFYGSVQLVRFKKHACPQFSLVPWPLSRSTRRVAIKICYLHS